MLMLYLLFDFKVVVPGRGEYFVNVLLYLCWGGGGSVALPLTRCRVGHVHKCFRDFPSFVFGGEPALKLSSLSCTGVGAGSQVYGLEFVGAFGFLAVCYLPPSPGWLSLTLYLYYTTDGSSFQDGILHKYAVSILVFLLY